MCEDIGDGITSFACCGPCGCCRWGVQAQRSGPLDATNRVLWRNDSALLDRGNAGEDLTGGCAMCDTCQLLQIPTIPHRLVATPLSPAVPRGL